MRYGQVPDIDVGEQAHNGRGQAPKCLHGGGREVVCAPLVLSALRQPLGVPLGGGSPVEPCLTWVNEGHNPHLELVCEHKEDVSPGFSTGSPGKRARLRRSKQQLFGGGDPNTSHVCVITAKSTAVHREQFRDNCNEAKATESDKE
jgi:hypothetical protein